MNKHYAFPLVAFIAIIFSLSSFGEEQSKIKFEIDGVNYTCDPRNKYESYSTCYHDKEKVLVLEGYGSYKIITKVNPPKLKSISEIKKDGELVFKAPKLPESSDTIENRMQDAYNINQTLFGAYPGTFADDIYKENKKYIDEQELSRESFNIVTSNQETLSCKKGKTRQLTKEESYYESSYAIKLECSYYSCEGKDPTEKILAYVGRIGKNDVAPHVLRMKNGQAELIDTNFKIDDGGEVPISEVNKDSYKEPAFRSGYTGVINPELIVPNKYDASKTSFEYLLNYAQDGFPNSYGSKDLCNDPSLDPLFAEKKQIASDMQLYLASADIITYLKSINGDIHGFYVDKTKGMQIGCYYDGKIVDGSVLPDFQRLESLAGTRSQDKYPSPKDVQKLFEKAQKMKDIPFGYKYDGCYARAHIMARRFEKMGVKVKKAWIKGDLSVPGTDIRWGYHVAPLIEAKDKDGKIQQYVIDPSLTDKAVTLDEWVATMDKNSAKGPIMKTTYPFAENGLDFKRTVVAVSSSDPYAPTDMKAITEEEKMENAKYVLQEYTEVLKANGK